MLTTRQKELVLFFAVIIILTSTTSYLLVKGYLYPFIITTAQKAIKEKTGRNVLIDSVELSFFPPELTLKDFTTSGGNKKDLSLTITEIRARLKPLQTMSGAIIIDDLEIKAPNLYLVINDDDMSIFPGFIQPQGPLKPSFFTTDIKKISISDGNIIVKKEGKGSIDLKNFSLTLDREKAEMSPLDIIIKSGEVIYEKSKEPFSDLHINSFLSNGKIIIHHFSIDSKDISLSGNGLVDLRQTKMITGSLRGKVPSQRIIRYVKGAPQVRGVIDLQTNFTYDEKGWNVKSDIAINKGSVKQIPLRKLMANMAYASGQVNLKSSFILAERHFKFRGNLSPASGRYEMEGEIDKITLPWLKPTDVVMAHGFKVSMKGGGNLKKSTYKGSISTVGTGQTLKGEKKRSVEFNVKGDLSLDGQEIDLTLTEDIEGRLKGQFSAKKESLLFTDLFINDFSDLSILLGYPLNGTADINGEIRGTILNPIFEGDIDFRQFSANGHTFERIWGHTNISKNLITSDNLKIEGERSRINIGGTLALKPQPGIEADISIKNGKLSELMIMANRNYPAKGNIKGDFHIEGPLKSLVVTAKMKADRLRLYGETIDKLTFKGKLNKQHIDISKLVISLGEGTVVSTGTIEPEDEINLDLQITDINPGDFHFIKKKAGNIAGNINLHCKLTGKSMTPAIEGQIKSIHFQLPDKNISAGFSGDLTARADIRDLERSKAELKVNLFEITPLGYSLKSTAPFAVNYVDHDFIISGLSTEGKQGNIDLNGRISTRGALDLVVSGETEVAGSEKYLKAVEEIGGALSFNSTIKGNIEKPLVNATLKADNGKVRFVGFPYDLIDIKSELTFEQNRMTIDSLKGILQEAQFTGGGNLIFSKLRVDATDLYFDVEEVALRYPAWLSSKGHGRVTITSKGKEVTLGSDLEITRALYSEELDFKNIMKMDSAEALKEKKSAGKKGLNFNMHFRADDNIIVKNNSADVEMRGHLNLLGQPNKPTLIGEIELIGGKIFFHNKEFSIISGGINFSDIEKINPFFDIEAETNIKDYNVNLSVRGSKSDYRLDLSSNPPLEEKEVVSLLVLGYTGSELKTAGTEMASIEAISLLLQGKLESKVKKYFGFDRFQIDPYYSEYSGSTEARITVGKELRENITATYSRGLSSLQDEQLNVEYRMDDNLSLMGSWSSQEEQVGQFGGDVILRYEFW